MKYSLNWYDSDSWGPSLSIDQNKIICECDSLMPALRIVVCTQSILHAIPS